MSSASHLTPRKTLSPENQAKIRCPVFPTDVAIKSCFELRELVWRGEGPEVRRGCQAAMNASKCPINGILKRIARQNVDPYHSTEPKVMSLDTEDLALIAPVLVLDMHMAQAKVQSRERELLEEANVRAREGGKLVRRPSTPKKHQVEEVVAAPAIAPEKTNDAAINGDFAAAINAEMKANG